jgi:dihydrodipicolinate synthase/N-acetylneuraminate lyase
MTTKGSTLYGAWSASPTPFTDSLKIDVFSLRWVIAHHLRLGQVGVFIGGTCGEAEKSAGIDRNGCLPAN